MCIHIKKNDEICKLSPNKEYCHIHNNIILEKDKTNLKKEIINLNKTIKKKSIKIINLNENLEFFKQEVNELNNKIKNMNENCKKYELIQKYTYLKNEIIKINKNKSPFKILTSSQYKIIIENKFNKSQDILLEEFENLRVNRNIYCH